MKRLWAALALALYACIAHAQWPLFIRTPTITGQYGTAPNTQTGASYTVIASDTFIIANLAGTHTLTLPAAATNAGRILTVKTIQAQTVVSIASNVVPCAGGAASTPILAATAGKWAEMVSDGTNWVIMACN